MALICLWAFALFFTIVPQVAQAQQPLIEKIMPHGNRRIPAETVRARIFSREGDVYDEAALQRDFSSLWNTGYYEDIRFEREESPKGYIIHIYLKERPTVRSIEYRGLSSVTNSDVLEKYKDRKVGLSVESQYDPTKIKKAEVVLKDLLASHGRQFSTIRSEVRPIPPAAVAITFVVKEGPKVKVGKIKFEGNKKLSSRRLRSAMKNTKPIGIPRSIVLENLFSRTFDSTKLQEDAERVRFEYQKAGYFKVIVADPKTNLHDVGRNFINPFSKAGKRVDITIPVDEGERFNLGKITFKGNKQVTNNVVLRKQFPMKDGEIFNTDSVRKGLENLRKAYGQLGYINFTPVPDTVIHDDTKTIDLEIDLDEGKQYSIRRIEFVGNTTTRDKVIRRELALEEGSVYNSQYWELSLLRLNQLQYFEPLKPEQDSETKRNDKDATVDLTLKVKEKGKNSIGLTGGVSGLSGSFIGLNYETNNFLGLGETLRIEANVGSRERNLVFGFSEPYLFDRPLNFGFTIFNRRYSFNQIKEAEIAQQQAISLPQELLDAFQNYRSNSTGFTVSASYPLRRSFKRVGLTYSFDVSSVQVFSSASRQLFQQLAFRNFSGPNSLEGVITSKVFPSFSFSTIDNPQRPHSGHSFFAGGDISGIGGNVAAIRPVVEWKHFIPMRNLRPDVEGTHALGYRVQGSFITGYRGLVANPNERFYSGGDQDVRGFDQRTITPYVFLTDFVAFPLLNPDGSAVPVDPTNPRRGTACQDAAGTTTGFGCRTINIPVSRITLPGGDTNIVGNVEYRIPIVGPVTIAAFADIGMNFITRANQLRLSDVQLNDLNSTPFGCPIFNPATFACDPSGTQTFAFNRTLKPAPGTNFVPRMSTGLELQVILPIVNAPFRIYYAYNPLLLDTTIHTPNLITRGMFPTGAAGDYTFLQAQRAFAPTYVLREPRKTFRFTVATTF
ncbi:MAG TPA: outer membrane protein assembly factor BamA [Terriglobales bacterium]|nr:outer membrane protein assembly factor BamA [Terriglobales bacterium]